MADNHLIEAGVLKLPEVVGQFADGAVGYVATAVAEATITAGNFEVTLTADAPANLPAAGFFSHLGRVYTYSSISGDTLVNCNGPFGDLSETDIAVGDTIIFTPVSANMIELLAKMAANLAVYQTAAQVALTVTIGPGYLIDGGEELAYAGGTLLLTDSATNHVFIYNNGGTPTVAANTTGFAAGAVAVSNDIVPLAVVVCAGGVCTSILDVRGAGVLGLPGASAGVTDHGALTGLSDDDHTIYALLAGRNGGQTLTGGTAAGDDLTLTSTSHGTKGRVTITGGDADRAFHVSGGDNYAAVFTNSSASTPAVEFNNGGGGVDLRLNGSGRFQIGTTVELNSTVNNRLDLASGDSLRIIDGFLELAETSSPSTPSSGFSKLRADSSERLMFIDDLANDGSVDRLIFRQSTVAGGDTLASFTANTAFASTWSMPANTMKAGKVMRITLGGKYSSTLFPLPFFALTLVWNDAGGDAIVMTFNTIAPSGSNTDAPWSIVATIICGATDTLRCTAVGCYEQDQGSVNILPLINRTTGNVTADTDLAATVKVMAQCSASDASNSITLEHFDVEIM